MKNFLISILLLTLSFNAFNQVQVCLGDDATVCLGQTVTITNCNPGAGSQNLQGINLDAPTVLQLSDDIWSNVIPIGFPFSFYGNSYNDCVIGSNGLISFNTSNANGYCQYSLTSAGTLPNSGLTSSLNSIMLAYQDMLPSLNSGSIQYQTIGNAPNRKFVVLYQNVYFYSCTTVCNYFAVVLNETANTIEMHIGNKAVCSAFNGGLAIQGIQNASGTAAVITPGRNNSVWTANQDSRLFTPSTASNTSSYVESQIPYVQINGINGSQQWGNTLGATFPYNNGVLNVNLVPPGVTGYFLTASACGAGLGAISDTTWITRSSVAATGSSTTDYCSSGVGTATIVSATGNPPFTYVWSPSGQTTQTATNLTSGTYSCTVTNSIGCSSNVSVNVPNSIAIASATATFVSCPGGTDGTATAVLTPSSPSITYNWYDAGGQTSPTAVGLAAGIYHCEVSTGAGCIDTAIVIVDEIPGMIATITSQSAVSCNSGNDGSMEFTVNQGTPPYLFTWDNSTSTTSLATDLSAGLQMITITDALGCILTETGTVTEPSPLSISFVTPDTTICSESSIDLNVIGSGGSSPYTFSWSENGVETGNGSSITVNPNNSGTVYCVTLTEACNSPSTDTCLTISFPTDIDPSITSNKYASCQPGTFLFTNNSVNGNEIASTVYQLGNGVDTIIPGLAGFTAFYNSVGTYSVDMEVTSIYGCIYTKTFSDFVEVVENPTAQFIMSDNPTTFFETSIQLHSNSTQDVTQWEWYAPDAQPIESTDENPTFTFPEGFTGVYPIRLIVTTDIGCIDTVIQELIVNSDIIFYAPNVFTPDGDEFNQNWVYYVDGIDKFNFELFIYNRWGELIWESHDPSVFWDGTFNGEVVPDGSYSWYATVKAIDSDKRQQYKGAITILK